MKKILKTKYLLELHKFQPLEAKNIKYELNNDTHRELSEKLYANALTLLKDDRKLLPLNSWENYYYLPLEEAGHQGFYHHLQNGVKVNKISVKDLTNIPMNSVVIIGLHKDNSTAYKPYKISAQSKKIITDLSKNHRVILNLFGSPYGLRDLDIKDTSVVVISYENNEHSMKVTAEAYLGKHKIWGKLPITLK